MAKYPVDIEMKREIAIKALKWCKKNLGVNRRKKYPKVSVKIKLIDDEFTVYGGYYWEDNRIFVNGLKCKSLTDVVSTVIHEYTHYLQSMRKYYEYFNTYYYSTHPFEREATRNSKQFTKKCLTQIKKSVD